MEIILAKSAGLCYGVARAVNSVYREIGRKEMVCLGPIIHNSIVVSDLEKKGVKTVDSVDEAGEKQLVIRAHGVSKEIYEILNKRQEDFMDLTCVDVKKIHDIVKEYDAKGFGIIIVGDEFHPEIIGVASWGKNPIIIKSEEEAQKILLDEDKNYAVVVQTTFPKENFLRICEILKNKKTCLEIFDTICPATEKRQKEAAEISKKVDKMIILGDKMSSNTNKLYEICKKNCKFTYFIESIHELQLNIFETNDKIGITAGASTPPEIIKEAVSKMSELDNNVNDQSFEEMLDESFVTLHTGDVVKGSVIRVVNGEVSVNLGYKSDGLITRTEFSEDPNINPGDVLKVGDEIEVFVVRVNDGEGNVLLSKKRLEMQKGFTEIEEAFNNSATVKGRIAEVVKGGLICMVKGVRVFVPSSQIASRYIDDLTQFIGKEFDFAILEYDRSKRRIVAGRRDLAMKEEASKKENLFASIEEGQRLEGVVSRIVDFGAFVDIGGADGLIHISEMSWGRVKRVTDVLKEGDKVTVTVLNVVKDKEKISLSLKDVNENPWSKVAVNYPVGAIVEGKVVRMVAFGAFVELEPGVDGLVHISQIANKHVVKPEDELAIGDIISVKVVDIDMENKKISLSKKEADGILNPQPEENLETLEETLEEAPEDIQIEETQPEESVE